METHMGMGIICLSIVFVNKRGRAREYFHSSNYIEWERECIRLSFEVSSIFIHRVQLSHVHRRQWIEWVWDWAKIEYARFRSSSRTFMHILHRPTFTHSLTPSVSQLYSRTENQIKREGRREEIFTLNVIWMIAQENPLYVCVKVSTNDMAFDVVKTYWCCRYAML